MQRKHTPATKYKTCLEELSETSPPIESYCKQLHHAKSNKKYVMDLRFSWLGVLTVMLHFFWNKVHAPLQQSMSFISTQNQNRCPAVLVQDSPLFAKLWFNKIYIPAASLALVILVRSLRNCFTPSENSEAHLLISCCQLQDLSLILSLRGY